MTRTSPEAFGNLDLSLICPHVTVPYFTDAPECQAADKLLLA